MSVLGDEATREETFAGLRSAASFLQAEIAREVRLRRIPKLRFVYDESIERGFRIESTLRDLLEERPAGTSPESTDGENDDSPDR